MGILSARKNLRIMRISAMEQLQTYSAERFVDFKSLIDGSVIAQLSFLPQTRSAEDFLTAEVTARGRYPAVNRPPTPAEIEDMLFGWMVEAGVSSNSVLYVETG